VRRDQTQIEPYAEDPNDPGRWAHSLRNLAELLVPCLDAAGARSVMEVGAHDGDLTAVLVEWAAGTGARVVAIDPAPKQQLIARSSSWCATRASRHSRASSRPTR
jgi:predicted O-methyltransferase YrrM